MELGLNYTACNIEHAFYILGSNKAVNPFSIELQIIYSPFWESVLSYKVRLILRVILVMNSLGKKEMEHTCCRREMVKIILIAMDMVI